MGRGKNAGRKYANSYSPGTRNYHNAAEKNETCLSKWYLDGTIDQTNLLPSLLLVAFIFSLPLGPSDLLTVLSGDTGSTVPGHFVTSVRDIVNELFRVNF